MTDKTQPDSGRATGGIVEMLHARIAELEARVQELGAMARENRSRRIVELEAQLAAVGACGVQALSAAPAVPNGDELRRIARSARTSASDDASPTEYVLAGWKAAMLAASPAPPAEQPIGELVVTKTKDGQIVSVTRQDDEGRILSVIATSDPAEQQAAPKAAPGEPYQDSTPHLSVGDSSFESWFSSYCPANKGDKQRARDAYAAGMGDPLVRAAPQQDAQEPVALLVRKNSWRAGQWEAAPPDSPSYGLAWANQRQYVYATPQPAPAPLSERDAFEKAYAKQIGMAPTKRKHHPDLYMSDEANTAWRWFQVGAAIAAQGGKA